MWGWFEKHAEIATNVSAMGAIFFGIIWLTGGTFPPWATAGDFNNLKTNVDIIILERDFRRCDDWNRRIRNAVMRLAMDPGNPVELDIIMSAREEIRRTPNCTERIN